MQDNLFYGGTLPSNKKTKKGFYWISTRLVREDGPWYAPFIKSPEDVASLMNTHKELEDCDKEYFIAIYLNKKGGINAICTISIGSLDSSIVHPREVFKPAIEVSAASVILVHNHPSGDPNPSEADKDITKRLFDAGKIIGISVLDHIIIGVGKHFSFKEKGLI